MSKTTSLLEEWEFRVTKRPFFWEFFGKGDETTAIVFVTHLCSHTKTLFNNTDPIWSVPRKIVFAPLLLLLLVSGGDVRRAHTQGRSRHAQTERERERERERTRYRTTTTPPKSSSIKSIWTTFLIGEEENYTINFWHGGKETSNAANEHIGTRSITVNVSIMRKARKKKRDRTNERIMKKLIGLKAKLYSKEQFKEKITMKKTITNTERKEEEKVEDESRLELFPRT